ncbi:iron chelate uptake ABC transporter family permease subunit [Rhodococcus sp. 06-469-3-2]|uniref:iron chelate uptake ABC transporter family permease subunit n=1 Tax=Rhodococcus sp. 06-469-3-2 TaxID=2022510 RepID=UPI000B9AC552|nr:iron chelate uptake ABC transporter family permease subunit [Rhodococcus sp. 06-469-3-2]OZC63069.1 Fe(3+)-siderophore ABC transporter permease [Rhodococcus sp. 06-469-3-2]
MSASVGDEPEQRDVPAEVGGLARTDARRAAGLFVVLGVLAALCLVSISVGTEYIPIGRVWHGLLHADGSTESVIVRELRLPRTVLGLLVGLALGVAGALIQAMTRNPLADPGILGVNAGAAFFVAIAVGVFGFTGIGSYIWFAFAVGVFGFTGIGSYIWFAFAGAVFATIVVYALGSLGRAGATPIRLTLSGIALGAVLGGVTSGMLLLDPDAFDRMRFWGAGSLAGRGLDIASEVAPFIALGVFLAALIARPLNAISLGDDLARSLGANVVRTRIVGVVAVTLLAGAATAAAGPIGFVGLMIPHMVRWIVGPDQRWILIYTVFAAPGLLLLSDVVGRIVIRPGELQVGIVTAFVGAPVLIVLVRRKKASGL